MSNRTLDAMNWTELTAAVDKQWQRVLSNARIPSIIRAAGEPTTIRLSASGERVQLAAAEPAQDGKPALRKFNAVVYNGGAIRVEGFWNPIVIDLAGLKVPRQDNPVLKNHDTAQIVGHTDAVAI